jgi:hypothetical protein
MGLVQPRYNYQPDQRPKHAAPDPAGVQANNNYNGYLNNLAGLLGPGNMPQGGQNPLGNMFPTMFGGGRRRGGGDQSWGGWQNRMRTPSGQQWLQPGQVPYLLMLHSMVGPDGINGYDYGGQAPQYAGQYGYIWRGDQPIAYDPN